MKQRICNTSLPYWTHAMRCYIFFAASACVQYGSGVLHILCCVRVCPVYIFFAVSACVQYTYSLPRLRVSSMGVTAEMLRPFLEGWTLKQIIDAKRLFLVDLKILEKIPTKNNRPVRYSLLRYHISCLILFGFCVSLL